MAPLTDYDLPSLEAALAAAGFRPVHARRVLREFYQSHGRPDFAAATYGRRLADWLADSFPPPPAVARGRTVAADGTTKLLVAYPDASAVECVLMPASRPGRAMACVSSP